MARAWVVVAVIAVAFVIYSLVDCAMADRSNIRGPRKSVWLLLIIILPVIGAVLWFLIGRPRGANNVRSIRPSAPDDDPEFLGRLQREASQEERIRRLEQELADLDSDSDDDPGRKDRRDGEDGTDTAGGASRRDV